MVSRASFKIRWATFYGFRYRATRHLFPRSSCLVLGVRGCVKSPTLDNIWPGHVLISGGNPHPISRFCRDELGPTTLLNTRASFTSHLYASLQNEGIRVYIDGCSLPRGDHISTSLRQAIEVEQSQISVIVFSANYAQSCWCVEELLLIMQCHRNIGQIVLPVFYDVDPSEVRHQTGEFGKGFQKLLEKFCNEGLGDHPPGLVWWLDGCVSRDNWKSFVTRGCPKRSWRTEICEAASLAGFVIPNSRNESEAIKSIVENVTHFLDKTHLFIANNPVGVETRVKEMIQMIGRDQDIQQSDDILLLGMWGMGGVGKTTIAKAIYNEISRNFEGRSFLANIREVWEQNVGQVGLQEQLLFDICKTKTSKIQSTEYGKIILKERLCHKRVLIVLDDVNTLDQLNALCGNRNWFGPGSRIIITTRDRHILRGNRVNQVYKMKHMDESESIELFSWHAFKQASPTNDFVEISRNVVEYSGGLPLALEVLGSYLFDREVREWLCVLEKLKRIPNDQVQKKLKISYDGLNDNTEKETFLDIACFFIGMDRNDVTLILNGCGLFSDIGISILVGRSLVTIDHQNRLRMHDLVRDMGREIIREKSPEEPEVRCRLWFEEDVIDILSDQSVRISYTSSIKGLALKLPKAKAKCFSTKAFKKMTKLRLLQLAGVKLDGDFEYLSKNLRWLSWNGFPLTHIPTNFCRENLVFIELENSNVQRMWKDPQMMGNLKILNLSHSHCLTHTPDFSYMPNLEKLVLKNCSRLSEVSPSIGHLNKSLLINLEDCISLCSLPRSIYRLKSLKTLVLSGCLKIDKLEEDLVQLESLTTLLADNTAITRVPFSIVRSKSIGYVSLCGYKGFSRDVFPSIIWSWMSPSNNLSSQFQASSLMSSLVALDVPSSSSHELSAFSNHLPRLRSLWVDCKSEDQLSLDAKIIVDTLYATVSKELESTATTSQVSNVSTSTLIQCCSQVNVSRSKHSFKSLLIQMGMNCQVTNILKEMILQNKDINGSGGYLFPGDSYPNWLTFHSEGSSVTFKVPQMEGRNLKSMMCIVYTSTSNNITSDGLKNVLVKNYTKTTIQLYKREALVSFEDEEGQRVVSSMEPGDKVEVLVIFENGFIVKKTSVYLVYDEPIDKKLELHHVPDLSGIACRGTENELSVKRFSIEEESTNDFNQNRRKKNRME
ncbi:disease resistance protein RUN1-like [Vicia villosa]|uniref:disease resistance protein RUN1-like n=1 Tax=Vicia villosa TaxID=3911 RepID=UPI00273B787B|nr:disease resistance protein RUN1-like [Vicia villosa]